MGTQSWAWLSLRSNAEHCLRQRQQHAGHAGYSCTEPLREATTGGKVVIQLAGGIWPGGLWWRLGGNIPKVKARRLIPDE